MTFCCERARSAALGRARRRRPPLGAPCHAIGRETDGRLGEAELIPLMGVFSFQIFFFSFWAGCDGVRSVDARALRLMDGGRQRAHSCSTRKLLCERIIFDANIVSISIDRLFIEKL